MYDIRPQNNMGINAGILDTHTDDPGDTLVTMTGIFSSDPPYKQQQTINNNNNDNNNTSIGIIVDMLCCQLSLSFPPFIPYQNC